MKTCFVIAFDQKNDNYLDLTEIAIRVALHRKTTSDVTIIVDQVSARLAEERLETIPSSNILVSQVPDDLNALFRSRFLKTKVRTLMDGPFVFVDSDALLVHPVEEVFQARFDFAAVLDRHRSLPRPAFPDYLIPMFQDLGWSTQVQDYYNSGVVFWPDTEAAHRLCARWHQNWVQFSQKFGRHHDQPSLNHTLAELKPIIKTLPIAYNAMVNASPWFARNAKVLHFYASENPLGGQDLLTYLLDRWKAERQLDLEQVDRCVANGTAWPGTPESLQVLLACRRYSDAFRLALRRLSSGTHRPQDMARSMLRALRAPKPG